MKKFSVKLARTLFFVSAFLLALFIGVYNLAMSNAAAITAALHLQTSVTIKGDSSGEDTEYFKSDYSDTESLKAYMEETCRKLEEEGMVLLRNEPLSDGSYALPLEKGSKVSLFGYGAYKFNYNSSGSSNTTGSSAFPTLSQALDDYEVNEELIGFYAQLDPRMYGRTQENFVYKIREPAWDMYKSSVTNTFAAYGDAAIYVISRDSGEGRDITTSGSDGLDGSYLSLSEQELSVLRGITGLKNSGTFKRVIVLLNSAVPVQLDFMFDDTISIDAALWVGNVGSTGIYAIGDVLSGDVVPSGRLSDTYVKDNFSSPAMASWGLNPDKKFTQTYQNSAQEFGETQNVYAVYVEGIYVGYRYYETRYADAVTGRANTGDYVYADDVAFPFGHGLSYTEFLYSGFELTENEDSFTATVNVMNIGAYAGKEVVQIYLQKPYTQYDIEHKIEKSAIELVGFAKTKVLESGEDQTVTVEIPKERLKSYDAYGAQTYIVDDGDYWFAAGKDAHNALNNILTAQGYAVEDIYADVSLCAKYHVDSFDDKTYSVSSETGGQISNRFDFSDINRYEGRGDNRAVYVSRNDWEGTWPKAAVSLSMTDQMVTDIRSNKPLVEDGTAMPSYGASNGLTVAMLRSTEEDPVAYDDPRWDDLLDQMTYEEQAELVTWGQHITRPVASVGKPGTTDENGPNSVSKSTTGVAFPSEGIWASTFDLELVERAGDALAEDALAAKVTGLYAPGVNMHRTPFGGRAHEYFSEDPYLSGRASVAEVVGMQKKGVVAYVKHYAVNNEETNRNGVAVWLNEQELREIMLLPFEMSFRPSMGNAHATMTSFNRIGCIWTSASSALMEGMMRDEWGFDGYSITDMADANAKVFMTFVDGIANGTNLYDGPADPTGLADFKGSAMFANKLRESAHRILYVTANFSASMNGISTADRVVIVKTWVEILALTLVIIGAVLTAASGTMLTVKYVSYYRTKKEKEVQDDGNDPKLNEIS